MTMSDKSKNNIEEYKESGLTKTASSRVQSIPSSIFQHHLNKFESKQ